MGVVLHFIFYFCLAAAPRCEIASLLETPTDCWWCTSDVSDQKRYFVTKYSHLLLSCVVMVGGSSGFVGYAACVCVFVCVGWLVVSVCVRVCRLCVVCCVCVVGDYVCVGCVSGSCERRGDHHARMDVFCAQIPAA